MSEEQTPRRTPPEVKRELARQRTSSREAVQISRIVALEILRKTGVSYAPSDEDSLAIEIADIVAKHVRDYARLHSTMLQRDVDELSVSLADERMRATGAVRTANMLKRSILDFVEDGNLERLTRRVFEGG